MVRPFRARSVLRNYSTWLIIDSDKQYTLTLKDTRLDRDPDTGREQATLSYEYDFRIKGSPSESNSEKIFVPWEALKATYRGREQKDAKKIDLRNVRGLSLMMRRSEHVLSRLVEALLMRLVAFSGLKRALSLLPFDQSPLFRSEAPSPRYHLEVTRAMNRH